MTDELGAQVLGLITHMDTKLSAHMADEGKELADMKADLHKWRLAAEKRHNDAVAASERRHSELIRSLDSWTTKMDVTAAFPKDEKGNPKLVEHCDEHLSSAEFKAEMIDIKKHVRKIGITAVIMGFLSWAGYILWASFVKGPQ